MLDTSGVGQIFGLGPEFPLVTSYESHAIVSDDEGYADRFPDRAVARRQERRQDHGRETLLRPPTTASPPRIWPRPKSSSRQNDKKGPLVLGAAGTYNGQRDDKGRFVVVGTSSWCRQFVPPLQRQSRPVPEYDNWLTSDEDLISIRPKEPTTGR